MAEEFASSPQPMGDEASNSSGSWRPNVRITRLFLKETGKEIRQRPVNYCLGACACFIVVLVIALLVTVLNSAPVLFLRLSELSRGETDVVMHNADNRLNYTLLAAQATTNGTGAATYGYHAPRIEATALVTRRDRCAVNDSAWSPYTSCGPSWPDPMACVAASCSERPLSAQVFALNQTAEARAGLGRAWLGARGRSFNSTDTARFAPGDCFINSELAGQLNVDAGAVVLVSVRLEQVLSSALWNTRVRAGLGAQDTGPATATMYVRAHSMVHVALRVRGVYDGGGGKHESASPALLVDGPTWLEVLANASHPQLNALIVERVRGVAWQHYVTDAVWNVPPLRVDAYRSPDLSDIERTVTSFASEMLYLAGWYQVEARVPVLDAVKGYRFFSLFLGLILNIIILFVFFLSVLLIYSLLMVSVEARTFELGILRMVGMTRLRLVGLVLTQALSFSVPAIAIGLPLAQVAAWGLTRFLEQLSLVQLSPLLTPLAICLAIFAGLLLPVVSSVLPIRAALSANIWDSVDTKRSKTRVVEYRLVRTSSSRPSATLLVVGVVLFALGFIIYYLLPLALLTGNIYLLLNIFFLVLIAMLIGLVVLVR